ncbi:MAG: stalk domain-containing protein, partial [Lachnospirales bacterium]
MKKIIIFFVFLISLFQISVYADNISVAVDGNYINFTDAKPQIINGRTMIPIRNIFNSLGADVTWNGNTKEITGKKNDTTIIMKLNSENMTINGYNRKMDTYPVVINDRTYVPAKYIAESLGYKVSWIDSKKLVEINKGNFVKVHFVDVGQGDCIVITDNEHCMVIDAGEEGNENKVVNYIKSLDISTIDYVVATHPHSDHIGSLDGVVNSFNIKNVIMPNVSHTSLSFQNLITAISNSKANVIETKIGSTFTLGKSSFTILGPVN